MEQIYTATDVLGFRDPAKDTALGTTYVMQGQAEEKVVNKYHLILAPTHACNLRCKHCYLPNHVNDLLPERIALRLIDEWADITLAERGRYGGIFHLKGGEPLLIPYLNDVVEQIIKCRSLQFMMTTNGTCAKPEHHRILSRAHEHLEGHLTIVVSLDGASSQTHDFLRGVGQFERTLAFLKYLQASNIHTILNCVLHAGNRHEIQPFLRLAQQLGVAQVHFLPLVPKGFGRSLRDRQEHHVEILREMNAVYEGSDDATKLLLAGSLPYILAKERAGELVASDECVAAYRGLLYVKPDGSAFSCPSLVASMFSCGNVKTTSLRDLMNGLTDLHERLAPLRDSDRYICTAERIQYALDRDVDNLCALHELQQHARDCARKSSGAKDGCRTSFCVSRNW